MGLHHYRNYLSVSSAAHIVVLLFILPIMVLAKMSDPIIMSIGMVFVLVCDVCIATFVSKTWEMFLGMYILHDIRV